MTNTEQLEKKIVESGLKISYIAKQIGRSRQTLNKKIKNEVPFNQYEIDTMCKLLNVKSLKEKECLFFY